MFSTIFSSVWKIVHTEHFLCWIRKSFLLFWNNLSNNANNCTFCRGMLNMYKFMCFFPHDHIFQIRGKYFKSVTSPKYKPTISIMFHFFTWKPANFWAVFLQIIGMLDRMYTQQCEQCIYFCIVRNKNTFSLQLTLTSDLLRGQLYWNFCFDSSEI